MLKFWDLIRETYKGKSIHRILMNWQIFEHCQNLSGAMIDMGAGKDPSYRNYWKISPSKFIRVDINGESKPDIIADLNKPLPLGDDSADAVFLFSVIYIIEKPEELIREIIRILKKGGKLYLYSPFIFNESREPNDYLRFTSQGLERLLRDGGFSDFEITPVGGRFTSALYLAEKIFLFKTLKLLLRMIALFLDRIYPKKLKELHPCPVGYFIKATK